MHYTKIVALTLLGVATANPIADYDSQELDFYARDVNSFNEGLAVRDAFFDDEAEAKLAIREALFDDDDEFYMALAARQVKRSPTKNLEKIAAKHAKSAFGMNRADVEKNNKKEKKAQIWNHQHQHQVAQADGKTKIYNNNMKETKDAIAGIGAATGLAKLGLRRRALIDAIYADLADY